MTPPPPSSPQDASWHELATAKLTRILGTNEGTRLLHQALKSTKLQRITTVDDLYNLAQYLIGYGGIAGAVGAHLSLQAAINGAQTRKPAVAAGAIV